MLDRSLLGEVTTDELSTRVDIPRDRLEALLSHRVAPSIHELGEIAEALAINPSYLVRPRPSIVARRDSGVDLADLDQLLERLDLHVAAFRRELDQPDPIPEAFPASESRGARAHGEGWAARHGQVWDPDRPDALAETVEATLRIPVLVWPVTDAPFGATLQLDRTYAIWVNSYDVPGTQQRFTLAHELGHVLLRHGDTHRIEMTRTAAEAEEVGTPDRRVEEEHANAFAGGVLYDYSRVAASWDREVSAVSVGRVAGDLGISYEAARVAVHRHMRRWADGIEEAVRQLSAGAAFRAAGMGHVFDWSERQRNRRRIPGILGHSELLGEALESIHAR